MARKSAGTAAALGSVKVATTPLKEVSIVAVSASPDIPYASVVAVMDALRADERGPLFPDVRLGGQTNDNYSQGKRNLTDSAIQKVVSRALATGALPVDANGVYFVLTSADVSKIGFLTQYCGWHSYGKVGTTSVKFAFVGNPAQKCPSSCGARSPIPALAGMRAAAGLRPPLAARPGAGR